MDLGYFGIGLVLVIGIAVVTYGWLADRTFNKRRQEQATRAPEREIPGLRPEAPDPTYLTSAEAIKPSGERPVALTEAEAAELRRRLQGAPTIPAGHAAAEFATGPDELCVLANPLVLVTDAPIITIRELLGLVDRARAASRPVVVVAPQIAPEVLTTLVVNSMRGGRPGCAMQLSDPDRRKELADLVSAQSLSLADLRAGYLPDSALGTCGTWVSSNQATWILDP